MTEPTQLTIDGRQEPLPAAEEPRPKPSPPERLFSAPETIRGQLAIKP